MIQHCPTLLLFFVLALPASSSAETTFEFEAAMTDTIGLGHPLFFARQTITGAYSFDEEASDSLPGDLFEANYANAISDLSITLGEVFLRTAAWENTCLNDKPSNNRDSYVVFVIVSIRWPLTPRSSTISSCSFTTIP